jgi:esterase/lipase superfamily enzyme
MNISYHTWESPRLGHGTELKVYGTKGQPLLVFPSSKGRFYDYENFGMIHTLREYIENEKILVFTIDGIDWQTWFNDSAHPKDKARRHEEYDKFVYQEVIPFIKNHHGTNNELGIIATGCSFGAYHAANFFFRHPDVITSMIALSGVYSLDFSVGDYVDDNVYFNDPLKYLPDLKDPWYLEKYKNSDIIICIGQGAFEDWMIDQSKALSQALYNIGVDNHWLDIWGYDVYHDWPWWKKQIVYFLGKLRQPITIY